MQGEGFGGAESHAYQKMMHVERANAVLVSPELMHYIRRSYGMSYAYSPTITVHGKSFPVFEERSFRYKDWCLAEVYMMDTTIIIPSGTIHEKR